MKDLKNIKFWLFDLDNTLYDGATKVFDQVDKKMSKFISEKLSISLEEARNCLLYTSPSPRDRTRSRMPSSA